MCAHIAIVAARRARKRGEEDLARGDYAAAERSFAAALSHLSAGAMQDPPSAVVIAAARIGLGRVCLGRGDPVRAAMEFTAALRAQPDSWQGFYWAGCAAAHRADYPGAEWNFTEALQRDRRSVQALVQRAYARLRQHADDTALTDLVSAARHGVLDENAWLVMASLQVRAGQWSQALTSLGRVQSPSWAPVVAALRAFAWEQQGDEPAALAEYQRACVGADAQDGVLLRHGLLALRLGRFEDSVRSCTELSRRYPQRAQLRRLVAQAHYAWAGELVARREFDSAIACLQRHESWEPPGSLDAVFLELHLHAAAAAADRAEQGGLRSARRHLMAARARRDDDRRVRHYSALLEFLAGAHHSSAQEWARLSQSRPGDTRSRHALAICAIQLGDLDQAERDLVTLSGAATDPVARRAARSLAALQVRRGRWQRAAELLESMTGDDHWRDAVLPECVYRSGRAPEQTSAHSGLWHAARQARAGCPDAALELLRQTDGGGRRARRELGLVLRKTALAQAQVQRWKSGAALLATSRELIGERSGFALLDAVVCVLGGRRGAAIQILAEESRTEPADHRITHALAVVLLHGVSADEVPATTGASWRDCIAVWVAILHDTTFWERWRRGAQRRYRTPVAASDVERSRDGLRNLLRERLSSDTGHSSEYGLLFQREVDAARVLDQLGGFPVPGTAARPLVCGPLRIAQLGLHTAFGAFAKRTADDDVLRCFSRLGIAHCHLREGRPKHALAALADLRCPHCAAAGTADCETGGTASPGPAVCVSDCVWFDADNPAYAALDDNRHQLTRDASALAVEALLRLGQDEITVGDTNLARASVHWQEAISRGAELDERHEVQRRVVDVALGRAETLNRRRDVDGAIAVLVLAREVTDASAWSRVDGQLARLLTDRGITTANADPNRLAESADDLRRAVNLNRHSLRARVTLARVLRGLARQWSGRGDRTAATMLLREAIAHCATGLILTPGHDELSEQRGKASAQLAALGGR
ncbi:MAG: tetratricopeptide repeat protein [Pseudonocardiaceae bacterium]